MTVVGLIYLSFRARPEVESRNLFIIFAAAMDKNRNIQVMGIVNLTDDSYYSGSRCSDVHAAIERIEALVSEGADIIDIGACSTRPGSLPVGADEEWNRLEPVLKAVKERFPDISISIDTYWASVVEKAYELIGPFIVNDISAGEDDPQMLPAVGRLGLQYIAMHKIGTPDIMQEHTLYNNLLEDILEYFKIFSKKAETFGIYNWILDPGFGFSKTIQQNYNLLKDISCFKQISTPDHMPVRILIGVSRKSMIYKHFEISPEVSLPATQVLHLYALQNGADILRVHDVAEARRTIELYRMLH
jgi:dihydropteroate synthase